MKKTLQSLTGLLLAVMLLFGGTAKEFFHVFAAHTDTVHLSDYKGTVLEQEHHHCDFLQYSLLPFAAETIYYFSVNEIQYSIPQNNYYTSQECKLNLELPTQRGPPTISA